MSPTAGTSSPNSISSFKSAYLELEVASSREAFSASSVHGVKSLTLPWEPQISIFKRF